MVKLVNSKYAVISQLKKTLYWINDPEIHKALAHVILRSEEFNENPYPVVIKGVGISGSSLRALEYNDIDIVVLAEVKQPYYDEWKVFEEKIRKNFKQIWGLINEYRVKYDVKKVDLYSVILDNYDELLNMGFKKEWLDYWFKYVKIQDFRKWLNMGLLPLSIDIDEIVRRYLKQGYYRKRLEIHVKIKDVKDLIDIPYLIVWDREKGVLEITEDNLLDYFRKEHEILVDIAENLLNANLAGLPPIYWDVLHILRDQPKPRLSDNEFIPNEAKDLITKLYDLAVKELYSKINGLKKHIKTKVENLKEYMALNSTIKTTLNKITVAAFVIKTLDDQGFIYRIIEKTRDINEFKQVLGKEVLKRGVRQGHKRKELQTLIKQLMTNN